MESTYAFSILLTIAIAPHALGQTGAPALLFKQRDKNGDGKISRDEIPAALFDRLDADKDGFVTEEELKGLWKSRWRRTRSWPLNEIRRDRPRNPRSASR